MPDTYAFLCDTYETEILKIATVWSTFPESSLQFRPAPKSRTVAEQFEHQLLSESKWMREMMGIDTGEPLPSERTRDAFVQKYRNDAARRLAILRGKPEDWWRETTKFFDVDRSRAWILTRRITHSAHHRGQLIVYLRVLEVRVPSVYGPTADTDGKIVYSFPKSA